MAGKQTDAGSIVEGYCEKYPKINNYRLARKIAAEEPRLGSVDGIYMKVRYYRGKMGTKHRDIRKRAGRDCLFNESAPNNVYELPEPRVIERDPFVLPKTSRRLLVLSDVHVPYHDLDTLKKGLDFGASDGCDSILFNGDFMDMYGPSSHDPDPRNMDLPREIADGRQALEYIRKRFPNIPIYYKEGNHEERLERYLIKNAPVLLGMEEFELRTILRLGELGIQWIADKRLFLAGKLTIIHGHEYKGNGGVNPARWLSLRTPDPLLCGHFHRTSSHFTKSIKGEVSGAWSTGCMCHDGPDYSPYNQWNQGFAMIHIDKDGTFEVENKMVIAGKVR